MGIRLYLKMIVINDKIRVAGWAQGQFIQQIPHAPQTPLEGYTQQYPNAIYQTTYQQPGFETNTFYASPVQVLTTATQRPPSQVGPGALTPRANGVYSHTPSPSPSQNGLTPRQTTTNISNQQYQQQDTAYQNPSSVQSYNPTTPTNMETASNGGISRPSSVGSNVNAPPSFTPTSIGSNSGNDKPGYPQVSSSPQLASHTSSGYPGGQYSGQNQQQITNNDQQHWEQKNYEYMQIVNHNNGMNSPQNNQYMNQHQMNVSPNKMANEMQQQHQQQQQQHQQPMPSPQSYMNQHQINQSPNRQSNEMSLPSPQNNHMMHQMNQSPNRLSHHQQPNQENPFSQQDRVNLNSRIKTMILNKQQSIDNKMDEEAKDENNSSTGHFLSYSHHRRLNYFNDGGGFPNFNPSQNGSAIENMMKFASDENYTKWNNNSKMSNNKPFSYSDNSSLGKNNISNMKMENYSPHNENHIPKEESQLPPQTIIKTEPVSQECKADLPTEQESQQTIKLEPGLIKNETETYIFEGNGGPAAIEASGGSWCCRKGGTEPPTSDHLKDGTCIGLQTQDEILEDKSSDKKLQNQSEIKSEKPNPNKEYIDNIEKLKNNIKTEIPDCNCFPPDKNPPEPGSYYTHLGKLFLVVFKIFTSREHVCVKVLVRYVYIRFFIY